MTEEGWLDTIVGCTRNERHEQKEEAPLLLLSHRFPEQCVHDGLFGWCVLRDG